MRPEARVHHLCADRDRRAPRAHRAAPPPRLPRQDHRHQAHVRRDHQQHVQARRGSRGCRALPPQAGARSGQGQGGGLRPGGAHRVRQGFRPARVHRRQPQDSQVRQGCPRRRRQGGQGERRRARRDCGVRHHPRVLPHQLQG